MKKLSIILSLAIGFLAAGCANTGYYNTQKGALLGAGLGALMGQAVGGDSESTMIGAGLGGLTGAVIGNGMDQQAQELKDREIRKNYHHSGFSAPAYPAAPFQIHAE